MKQKADKSQLVTKAYLEERLDFQTAEIKEIIDERFKEQDDKVMTKLDYIVSELEKMREDREIGAYQTRELRQDVDGHEKRITQLESPTR